MGATALVTIAVTYGIQSRELWFVAWMGEAALASVIGIIGTLRKAKTRRAFLQGPGRKFAMPPRLCFARWWGKRMSGRN